MKINMKRELELYLHIPFCVRKCNYCDFFSASGTKEELNAYVQALCKEINRYKDFCKRIYSKDGFPRRRNTVSFDSRSDETNF